jgi:hypothetical protein
MNALRIYTKALDSDTPSGDVLFYSRRADGPYYRWCYEKNLGHWRGSRMQLSDLTPRELSLTTWKRVPESLKATLGEHYLE